MNDSTRNYLSCRVGREWYGIPLEHVSKVLHMVALSELPDASPDVIGLLVLQKQVIPVIDLRRRFGVEDTTLYTHTPIVVLETSQSTVALAVDDVDDVEAITEAQVTAYDRGDLPYVCGVAKQTDRLLMLLDVTQITYNSQTEKN